MIDMKWARDRMNGVKQQPVSNVEKASGTRNWKHIRRSNHTRARLVVAGPFSSGHGLGSLEERIINCGCTANKQRMREPALQRGPLTFV
jgi:hypothetical protein